MSINSTVSKIGVSPAHSGWQKLRATWGPCDSAGSDSGTVDLTGSIHALVTVPGTGGAKPSDQYDITLLDEQDTAVDLLNSAGLNRASDGVEFAEPVASSYTPTVSVGSPTLKITNASSDATGTCIFFIKN